MAFDFDPNKPQDAPDHKWGTYAPSNYGKNRGKWKTHKSLKDVRSAIDWNRPIAVYKLVGDKWEKILELTYHESVPVVTDVCYICGKEVGDFERRNPRWSPDHDFEKVLVHWRSCERKLKPRK